MVTQAAESSHSRQPGTCQGSHMQTFARVAPEVAQVNECRFAKVIAGEVEVANFGGNDSLNGRRKRGVTHGNSFVVVEILGFLFRTEAVTAT
jgi:hypothetical protein